MGNAEEGRAGQVTSEMTVGIAPLRGRFLPGEKVCGAGGLACASDSQGQTEAWRERHGDICHCHAVMDAVVGHWKRKVRAAQGRGANIPSWKLHPIGQIFSREGLWRLEQDPGWALRQARWSTL